MRVPTSISAALFDASALLGESKNAALIEVGSLCDAPRALRDEVPMIQGKRIVTHHHQDDGMDHQGLWDEIALGRATADEARALVRSVADGLTRPVAERLYNAFRAWTWKALDQRRRDATVRQWHEVFQSTDALLAPDYPDIAAQMATLAELIYESVSVGEACTLDSALQRPYVRDYLLLLQGLRRPSVEADIVIKSQRWRQNAAMILNFMRNCELVASKRDDKGEVFALTELGRRAARDIEVANRAKPASRMRKRARTSYEASSATTASRNRVLGKEPSRREREQPRPAPHNLVSNTRESMDA